MANTTSIKLSVKLQTYNGSTLIGESATLTNVCYITNCNPEIDNTTYEDTNAATVAITGDNQLIIQNKSNLVFTLPTATALKGASISKYEITLNGVTLSRTTAGTLDFGAINVAGNITANVKVTDSRGNSNTINKTVEVRVLAWELPQANITAQRRNNYYSTTALTVRASYSSLNNQNTLTIQYQYKKTTDSTYSALANIDNNTPTDIELDNLYDWDVKVVLTDRLGSSSYNLVVSKGLPLIYFDYTKNSVGINCFPANSNSLEINGKTLEQIIDERIQANS